MERKYRVGLIGCGGRGRAHAAGLRADERCQVVALADIKPEAAGAINEKHGFGATVYTDYRELLERERPDMVVICLWTPLHLPVLRDVLAAGVRIVHGEKPVAPTWGAYQETARLAEQSGCQLTFCHQRRFARGNRVARELIASGRFGQIERMDLYSPKHLLDCGTHTFDQAMSFNAESPIKWGIGALDISETFSYFNVPAEIMATGHVQFENGVRASLRVGGPAADGDMGSGVRVIGSDGFLEVDWDGRFGKSAVYSDPAWRPPVVEKDGMDDHMIGVIRHVVDCAASGQEPELSHKHALRAGEAIFALYESARRRARVVPPLENVTGHPLHELIGRK